MTKHPIHDARMGSFVKSLPVPHEVDSTKLFPAGPVTIGLEYRVFDPVAEAAKFTAEEIAATGPDSLFNQTETDRGVCVHVFGTEDQAEYLRFDCFLDEPHYHYIVPGDGNMLIHFDEASNGPMLEWVLDTVRHQLGSMLELVGATHLSESLDEAELGRAMDEVGPLAREQMASY
jgi:hypothetical protein